MFITEGFHPVWSFLFNWSLVMDSFTTIQASEPTVLPPQNRVLCSMNAPLYLFGYLHVLFSMQQYLGFYTHLTFNLCKSQSNHWSLLFGLVFNYGSFQSWRPLIEHEDFSTSLLWYICLIKTFCLIRMVQIYLHCLPHCLQSQSKTLKLGKLISISIWTP